MKRPKTEQDDLFNASLTNFKEKEREHIFPVQSHRDVVNLFLEAMNQQNYDGYAAIQSDAHPGFKALGA